MAIRRGGEMKYAFMDASKRTRKSEGAALSDGRSARYRTAQENYLNFSRDLVDEQPAR
jgi:hypothetical protein